MLEKWWSEPWFTWPAGWISGILSSLAAVYARERWRRLRRGSKDYLDVSFLGGVMRFEGQYEDEVSVKEIFEQLLRRQEEAAKKQPYTVRALGMEGPYKLDIETIEARVTRTSPGNYALGNETEERKFLVGYVGRSDSDVRARLRSWVSKTRWSFFKFSYATSPKEAFEKECENYHNYAPPQNDRHPERPEDTDWSCPSCNIFE